MADRTCRDCRTPITGWQRSGYCPKCREKRCAYCREPLPPRESAYGACTGCARSYWEARKAKERANPHRVCDLCGCPVDNERAVSRCPDCSRQVYEDRRKRVLRMGVRPCQACGEPMPVGRLVPRCTGCQKQHLLSLPAARKQCAICGLRARKSRSPYCTPCNATYRRWSEAYDRGDPAARMVRKKRPPRRTWEKPGT